MNREKKRFWIGFDGFDSFGYNFDTREEAETYFDENRKDLYKYYEKYNPYKAGSFYFDCEYCVEIYDRGENK